MNKLLRAHADAIVNASINAVKPDEAVARALAGNPEILILDDSSSALDYQTDAALRRAIHANYQNTTTILIAQRISSLRHADLILVLQDGVVIGAGSHDHLMNTCDEYRIIAQNQMGTGREGF